MQLNDSYSSSFASQDQRRYVMCQELGHTIGLGHTTEDGSSQDTCMDYSTSPTSTAPNQHDYDQLVAQYAHTDSYNSYSTSAASTLAPEQNQWPDRPDGHARAQGRVDEMWVAPNGKGGIWVHHVTLAPEFEHTELLD